MSQEIRFGCTYRKPNSNDIEFCNNNGIWNLWFLSTGGLYTTVCTEHASRALKEYANGKDKIIQLSIVEGERK